MKVLVVGGGGREHAICSAFKKSKYNVELYCAPGNAGISEIATCVNIKATDIPAMVKYAKENEIELVFVAPDDPLALGMVDALEEAGIRAFGPKKNAAIIEASKSFSKEFMKKYGIPTAKYETFDNIVEAEKYLEKADMPIVLKADGLALGKGVIIANTRDEAIQALHDIMQDKKFGSAGDKVVIEEFLTGPEATILVFTDGKTYKIMPSSQDHKKAYDGDKGLNTGGMGAFSPSPKVTKEKIAEIEKNIIIPTINGLNEIGRTFKGVIYFGLMLTNKGVKVIEYNARFGDPETEAILPLLKTDIVDICNACIDGTLGNLDIEWEDKTGFCVVIASGEYPGSVVKGHEIKIGSLSDKITLFHSGTKYENGHLVNNGGRVICVTTIAKDIAEAREIVYKEIDKIQFENCRYRKDIGIKD